MGAVFFSSLVFIISSSVLLDRFDSVCFAGLCTTVKLAGPRVLDFASTMMLSLPQMPPGISMALRSVAVR